MGGLNSSGSKCRRLRERQSGFVLALFCIAITTLLAFAAFCVDLGNWYFHIQLEQRAADSASLAGAAYLPGDPNSAISDATKVLSLDGFNLASPCTTTCASLHPVPGQPDQMYVSVTQKVNNIFLSLFGDKSITLTRVSIAVDHPPMLFGSPDNVMGQEPAGSDLEGGPATWGDPTLQEGDYFLQVSAPGSLKINGAEFTAGSCLSKQNLGTGNNASNPENDQCDTAKPVPTSNLEFNNQGDSFELHVPAGVSGNMAVDLYDPTFVDTETECNDNLPAIGAPAPWQKSLPASGNPNAWEFDPSGSNPGLGGALDPAAEKYCDGDREELGGTIPKAFSTRFWVTYPNSNNVVPNCDITYGGWEPQYDNINELTNPTAAEKADPTSIYNTFHKWARLCDINVGGANPVGNYTLHVNVPYPQNGGVPVGTNDYSLRIGIMDGGPGAETLDAQTSQLQIYDGNNEMEATSVGLGTYPQYYLGQITPNLAGQTIKIRYFDLGDNAKVDLHILPPRDATVNGSPITEWPSCTWQGLDGTPLAPTGPALPAFNCSYQTTVSRQFDGKIIEMDIQVPAGYSCGTDGKQDDCWFQGEQEYTGIGGNGLYAIDDYWTASSNFSSTTLRIIH